MRKCSRLRRLRVVLATTWLGMLCASILGASTASGACGPTKAFKVEDSVAATRILGHLSDADAVFLSPNRKRYLVMLIRGDLQRNGNWVEFWTGVTSSLDSAQNIRMAAALFTSSGQANPLRYLRGSFTWLRDGKHVLFLWQDGVSPKRIVQLDLTTGRLDSLITAEEDIQYFSASASGEVIIYTARSADSKKVSASMLEKGFAVSSSELHPLLAGYVDGRTPWNYGDLFVWVRTSGMSRRVQRPASRTFFPPRPSTSPDGKWAVVELAPSEVPDDWLRYASSQVRSSVERARTHNDTPGYLSQLWLIDSQTATARPLWIPPGLLGQRKWLWSPDSRSVVLGPTLLPVNNDPNGDESVVVEINLLDGSFVQLPLPSQIAAQPASWDAAGRLELTVQGRDRGALLEKSSTGWSLLSSGQHGDEVVGTDAVQIEWRQDFQTPPALYAKRRQGGRGRLIMTLNSCLYRDFTLGKVELVKWKDRVGRPWSGRLYFPVGHSPGRRYPLVIQSHPLASPATQYSLTGHEGISTAFAAQPLANRGIAVLQMSGPDGGYGSAMVTTEEREIALDGFASAIDHFVETGLAARDKIGLIGFSRSGQYVTYALTRPEIKAAAAIVADNHDASYVQYLFTNSVNRLEYEQANGAPPFGEGLREWLARAPGFNADKIHTPLRMEREAGGLASIIASWELFSNLRYLNRPVELFVVPEIEDAAHSLEKPAQVLASLSGTVDWMDFWLNNHESAAPERSEQYARWRKLRQLREAVQ